jgi:hypothetical protein
MPARHREEVLNTLLARTLIAYGVNADPETISPGGREKPDVVFSYRGLRCVIEGKYSDVPNHRDIVTADAQGRLNTGLAQLGIAVVYPARLRTAAFNSLQERLAETTFEFRILSETGVQEWKAGGIDFILSELRHAQEIFARDDAVQQIAEVLSARLEGVANLFLAYPAICDRLTAMLGVSKPSTESAVEAERRRRTVAKIAALTVANAFVFQEQLALTDERVRPLSSQLRGNTLISEVGQHWDWICSNINYVPIFRIAANIFMSIPSSAPAEGAVRVLAEQAITICSNKAALRHDLMGRIYHWLLHDAKFLGTYYTSVSAATLLLQLALSPRRWQGHDFGDFEDLKHFAIADPACGTGTLLMAASQAVTDNFIKARVAQATRLDERSFRNLHQTIMENMIHGYDVLSSAIHLTASTLAMLAPEVSFRKMQLYTMPMGRAGRDLVRLGSLDFLASSSLPLQMTLTGAPEAAAEQVTGHGSTASQAPMPGLDLCVMNPPFVRSVNGNLLFGSLPDARGEMQAELKRIVEAFNAPANITAGLGSVFIAVADKHLKRGGRMALVIPAAVTTGDAWQRTRDLFDREYHLDVVVCSHDPSKWSFSENTDLSEVLVVVRRRLEGERPSPSEKTQFINLWINPSTSGEALSVAQAANTTQEIAELGTLEHLDHSISPVLVGARKFGEIVEIPTNRCARVWPGSSFAQTDVLRAALHLEDGYLVLPAATTATPVPLVPLGTIADFGPDGRDIHDGFLLSENVSPYAALWGTDGTRVTSMEQQPNRWLLPRVAAAEGRPYRDVSLLWPRAARIMLSSRLRLNTQRLAATLLPELALSNIWSPVRLREGGAEHEKALILWLNSTLGTLLLLLIRVPTEGGWIQFKKPNFRALKVLDVHSIAPAKLAQLAGAYDSLKNRALEPYARIAHDSVRAQIDGALSSALSLPSIEHVRAALGREPVITSQPLAQQPTADEINQTNQLELLFGT